MNWRKNQQQPKNQIPIVKAEDPAFSHSEITGAFESLTLTHIYSVMII